MKTQHNNECSIEGECRSSHMASGGTTGAPVQVNIVYISFNCNILMSFFLATFDTIFCRCLFKTSTKSNHDTINFVETFNDVINDHRCKPVYMLCEDSISKITNWFVNKHTDALTWKDKIVPHIKEKLKGRERDSRALSFMMCWIELF